MNRYDLHARHAIVTGGAGGFGRAIADMLLRSGASVSLWDVDAHALSATAASLDGPEARVAQRRVDVRDTEAIDAALAQDRAAFDRVDILVNNAGVLGATAPVWETDPALFRHVVDVNLTGAFLCLRAVLPVMRAQARAPHRGHVVNVASIQGKEGMPRSCAYSASKAALLALTQAVAKEVAREGIVVNCIVPAAVETAMATLITAERKAEILERIPMGRFATVDDIARTVAWLASDECAFTTGAAFDVSGGRATW